MNKRYAIVTSTNCYTSITLVTINKLSLLPKQKCKLVKEHISTTYLVHTSQKELRSSVYVQVKVEFKKYIKNKYILGGCCAILPINK